MDNLDNSYRISCKEFGLTLAKLRESKGVSARQMSLDIGQNKNYINAIETGNNFPNMSNFFSICEYLHITPQRFFQAKDSPTFLYDDFLQLLRGLTAEQYHHLYLIACDLRQK